MANGEVVMPDASSISGIAAVIEPSEGGEMVRLPGTRKPVRTQPPPPPRGQTRESLLSRVKKLVAPVIERATRSEGATATTTRDDTGPIHDNPPGTRRVRCFDCGNQLIVSNAARSTQCGRCSAYISLEDYEITTPWSQSIHTRGDIVVGRKGRLVDCDVTCHNLTVLGHLSASVDCSGDAVFRSSSQILGSLHCRHLRVEKGAEVSFPQGVFAEGVEAFGQIDGNVLCSGTVRIHKKGSVNGDATARAIDLKDGGLLTGQMSIQHEIEIPLPPKRSRRFDDESED